MSYALPHDRVSVARVYTDLETEEKALLREQEKNLVAFQDALAAAQRKTNAMREEMEAELQRLHEETVTKLTALHHDLAETLRIRLNETNHQIHMVRVGYCNMH